MSVFSKFARESVKPNITWDQYFNNNINLQKLKLDELKGISKANGLYVSGTKDVVISRIIAFFTKVKKAVVVQAIYRGHKTRHIFKMRGEGLLHRDKCVNDTDFFTLDTIHDVDVQDFFSYTDKGGFTYGFDLNSLKLMLRKHGILSNPYTREQIEGKLLTDIIALFKYQSLGTIVENEETSIFERLRNIRSKPYQTRIRELFCEIDNLGNYTDSEWFTQLNRYELIGFLRNIYEIWQYRAEMSTQTKTRICPYFNPFSNGLVYFSNNISALSADELGVDCVTVMENMIYTGIDTEYKKLGALHVLSALTLVSIPAKNSMPWLYDSLVY
jgi:hypothetical protein